MLLEHPQGFGVATASVQRGHEQRQWTVAERLRGDQPLEVADNELGVPALQPGGGELLEPHHTELLEPECFRVRPGLIGELRQRRSPPPAEAVAQLRSCPLIITVDHCLAGGGERRLEAPGVDGVAVRDEHVAGRLADDSAGRSIAVVKYVAQP